MNPTTTWTTHIKATPEAVFAELGDIEKHASWSEKTYKASKTSEGPIGVGTTYDTWGWLPPKGKEYQNKVTIKVYEPGKRLAFDAVDPSGPIVPSDFVLTPEDGGTRVDRTMTMPKPGGFSGVTWPIVFPMLVKPAIQKNLTMFKAHVESKGM